MNSYELFQQSLNIGQKYELWIAEQFSQSYGEETKTELNEDGKYDFNFKNKTFEVKTDSLVYLYENIIFEVQSWGEKPSGIVSSKSDKWLNIQPQLNKVYMFDTSWLKNLLELIKTPSEREAMGFNCFKDMGDEKASRAISFDHKTFIEYATEKKQIKILNIEIPNYYDFDINDKNVLMNRKNNN